MPILHDVDPIAIHLGPVGIHWYGLSYLLAFATFWWLGARRIRRHALPGVDVEGFGDLCFYGMLGAVLGGRIGYVLFYGFAELVHDPLMLLRVWEGGMSFHGGLLGVLIAVAWWSRAHGRRVWDTLDFVAPLAPPGLGFGRIANYINGELWGKFTGSDWGVIFPQAPELAGQPIAQLRQLHASGALDGFARHPSQLYQALLEGLVLFVALYAYSRKPRPRYAASGLFALLYGLFRFVVEFVRVPDAQLGYLAFDWLTMGQLLSLPLVLLGAVLLWLSRSAPRLRGAAESAS